MADKRISKKEQLHTPEVTPEVVLAPQEISPTIETTKEQEHKPETVPEQEQSTTQEVSEAPSGAAPNQKTQSAIVYPKDALTQEIERILEGDLEEMYFAMPPEAQTKFKVEGEKVTQSIRQMMKSGVVKMRKILSLITDWLKIIPGVNKFFLEKQAKIKAEKILNLRDQ